MTKKVIKYTLTHNVNEIEMAENGQILSVQMQGSTVVIWVMIYETEETKKRIFRAINTGDNYTFDEREHPVYIGTVQTQAGVVWHIFEEF